MKTVVYLVRHGDVQNPNKILYERMPGFPLSDLGRQQAHKLGKFLKNKKISAVYASPLERTSETAGIIASYHNGLTPIGDERLLEISTPARGRKFEELAADRWNFYRHEHIKGGGERLSDIWHRMRVFFRQVTRAHRGEEIVVVSHGDPIMISYIKHSGKRLSLSEIRGVNYIDTAKGFAIVFEEFRATEVSKLDF